jgi:hypothetical protein
MYEPFLQLQQLRQKEKLFPFEKEQARLNTQATRQNIATGAYNLQELKRGEGLRSTERNLGQIQTSTGLRSFGFNEFAPESTFKSQIQSIAEKEGERARQERERAYSFNLEKQELDRLSMASQAGRLQSQMSVLPQFEAIRGGIMGRMASNLGVNLPNQAQPYSSGTGYTPSWSTFGRAPTFPMMSKREQSFYKV